MKLLTYNVNGIRSAIKKGFLEWLQATEADIVCLQEIKANPDQVDFGLFHNLGYEVFWYPAEKKGYSGVAILSKLKPIHVEYGCGIPQYDAEGRTIRLDFADFSIISVYMPSGTSGEERQTFKFAWLADFYEYVQELRKNMPNLLIAGDYNICRQPIDIHNPKQNQQSSGFLPEERAWFAKFVESGFVDTFRQFNTEPHNYTWWSTRAGSREKNLGWRIDYFMASLSMQERLENCQILPNAVHSDHCPVWLSIK